MQARLVQIGAVAQRVGSEFRHGAETVTRGNVERIGGNDAGVGDFGVFVAAARNHVLKDGLLLLAQAAGVDQILARGEYLRIGARHLYLCEGAFLDLRADIG